MKQMTAGGRPLILLGCVLAMGCQGEFWISGGDGQVEEQEPGDDALEQDDGAQEGTDLLDVPDTIPDTPPDSPPDSLLEQEGDPALDPPPSDPDVDPETSCSTVTCGASAHCEAGVCVCDDGYVDVGGGVCHSADPGDPESRTEDEVCTRWNTDYTMTASWVWNEGATQCDIGEVNGQARDDGVRRINLYRWLTGLGPVTRDSTAAEDNEQECAVLMMRNGTINHFPPSSWTCYAELAGGVSAAGASNLAYGSAGPAGAIDLYVADWGNYDTMGHRRWVLNPPYGRAAIGDTGGFNCLHVFDYSGTTTRPFVAYPSPGPFPLEAAVDAWTFSSDQVGSGTTVTVLRQSDGSDLGVTASALPSGYGQNTVLFEQAEAIAGETYIVTVAGLSGGDITYRVRIVDCS